MDASDLVGDGSDTCSSLDSAHIRIRSVKKTVKATVGIDVGWTTLGVHARVLILVVVESHGIGLSTSQDWPL